MDPWSDHNDFLYYQYYHLKQGGITGSVAIVLGLPSYPMKLNLQVTAHKHSPILGKQKLMGIVAHPHPATYYPVPHN